VLVATLARGLPLRAYARRRRRLLAVPRALAGLLLFAADRPRVRHGFVGVVARHPALLDRLVALNAGETLRARRARDPISLPRADRGTR
jgi:hypothetical protein